MNLVIMNPMLEARPFEEIGHIKNDIHIDAKLLIVREWGTKYEICP